MGPHKVAQHRWVVLHWVAAHCGLPGNENAEQLTKLGAKGSQQDNSVTFQKKKTVVVLPWGHAPRGRTSTSSTAGCGHETTHGPQPTKRPHVQENEAGTITNLQMRSWRSDSRTYTAEMPASADSNDKCVANGSPATQQTLGQQEGPGEDSYIHLVDQTPSVVATEKKKMEQSQDMHTLWI